MPRWSSDEAALADLHRGTRAWLNEIRGVMVDEAPKGRQRHRPGWGAFLDGYERHTKLLHFAVDRAKFLEVLRSSEDRLFLRGLSGEATLQAFLTLATSRSPEDRRAAAGWAREIGNALDPPRTRGQASKFDSRRIAVLYRWLRRINNSRKAFLDRFLSPPPASWLPAFIVSGGLKVKMDDEDWAHLAAIECLAAALDVSDHTIESHLRKASRRS